VNLFEPKASATPDCGDNPAPRRAAALTRSPLAWAIYLGISWTWCIGMFFPVLLLHYLGWGGFWVFAIPNVLGAAAMGWILRDASQSKKIVEENTTACIWFSLVTIAYQAFFAAWIIRKIAGPITGIAIACALGAFWLIVQRGLHRALLAAIITLIISLMVIAWGTARHELPRIALRDAHGLAAVPTTDAIFLAPICLFGFALCPYLDLTFHTARQHLSREDSRYAFSFGFGVVFAIMLVFTAAYSGWLANGFDRLRHPQMELILATHLIIQCCFTIVAHAQIIVIDQLKLRPRTLALFALLAIAGIALGILDQRGYTYAQLSLGEITYRLFLGFYGLLFPAYIWLAIVPSPGGKLIPRATITRALPVILLLAAPFYWLAFVQRQMYLLIPGVMIPILAKFVLPKSDPPAEMPPDF
jgi:hypothetical protein